MLSHLAYLAPLRQNNLSIRVHSKSTLPRDLRFYFFLCYTQVILLHMITLNPLILRVQVMFYPFLTIMLNPSNTSMGMCFLETTAAYMKLWVAPTSINVVTLCPCKMPLTLSCSTWELLKEWKWSSSQHHPIVVQALWMQAMVAPPHYDMLNLG